MFSNAREKTTLILLDPTYLASISYIPQHAFAPVIFQYKNRHIDYAEIKQSALAEHVQDLIIAKQIDENLFNTLRSAFPDALAQPCIFPEKDSKDLFFALGKDTKVSVNTYLESLPADDDYSDPEQLLEKVRMLTLSGQYERAGNILIALAPWVDGELTLAIATAFTLLETIETPFEYFQKPIFRKNALPASSLFFQSPKIPECIIHEVDGTKLNFMKNKLTIIFAEQTTMSVEVFDALKMQLLGCDDLKELRDMFRFAADDFDNKNFSDVADIINYYCLDTSVFNR